MDVNLGEFVAVAVGVAVLVTVWARVRAFEAGAVDQSTRRVVATQRAIGELEVRLSPPSDEKNGSKPGARGRRKADRTHDFSKSGA